MSDTSVKGVLVGLVDTGEGYGIGIAIIGGGTVVLHPGQAASIADVINGLLEGLGFDDDEIDMTSGGSGGETLQ